MKNLNAPEEGKIYISEVDPTLQVLVENVQIIPACDESPQGFYVEGCNPDDADDMGGIGYEFLENEWADHKFVLATS